MPAEYHQDGLWVDHTPVADLTAGDVVLLGSDLYGVPANDIPANVKGAVNLRGAYKLPKDGSAYTAGDTVEYDVDVDQVVPYLDANGDGIIGLAIEAAAAGASWVNVLLNGRNPISRGPWEDFDSASESDVANASWTTPGNVTAADGSNASIAFTGEQTSNILRAAKAGATLPAGANFLEVRILGTNLNLITDLRVQGGTNSVHATSSGPDGGGYLIYKGTAAQWGATVATNFNLDLIAGGTDESITIDHIQYRQYEKV